MKLIYLGFIFCFFLAFSPRLDATSAPYYPSAVAIQPVRSECTLYMGPYASGVLPKGWTLYTLKGIFALVADDQEILLSLVIEPGGLIQSSTDIGQLSQNTEITKSLCEAAGLKYKQHSEVYRIHSAITVTDRLLKYLRQEYFVKVVAKTKTGQSMCGYSLVGVAVDQKSKICTEHFSAGDVIRVMDPFPYQEGGVYKTVPDSKSQCSVPKNPEHKIFSFRHLAQTEYSSLKCNFWREQKSCCEKLGLKFVDSRYLK